MTNTALLYKRVGIDKFHESSTSSIILEIAASGQLPPSAFNAFSASNKPFVTSIWDPDSGKIMLSIVGIFSPFAQPNARTATRKPKSTLPSAHPIESAIVVIISNATLTWSSHYEK